MQSDSPSPPSQGRRILRWIAGGLALVATPSAALDWLGMFRGEFDPILASFAVCTTLFVVLCAWFALRGDQAEVVMRLKHVLAGGLVVGGIGFAVGFFGPLILAPEANQGPLLGIFITGPMGFALGCVLGWLVWPVRARSITPSRS